MRGQLLRHGLEQIHGFPGHHGLDNVVPLWAKPLLQLFEHLVEVCLCFRPHFRNLGCILALVSLFFLLAIVVGYIADFARVLELGASNEAQPSSSLAHRCSNPRQVIAGQSG